MKMNWFRIGIKSLLALLLIALLMELISAPAQNQLSQVKALASMLQDSSPEQTLQFMQQARHSFYDILICQKEQCLTPAFDNLRSADFATSVPLQQGFLVLLVNPKLLLIRNFLTFILFLSVILFFFLKLKLDKKVQGLIQEHAKFKSFYHDIQQVLGQLEKFKGAESLKKELSCFKMQKQLKCFYSWQRVYAFVLAQGQHHQLAIHLETPKEVAHKFYFHGDLYRNLKNLIKNAAEAKAKNLTISLVPQSDGYLQLKVQDDGQGMSPAQLKSIRKQKHKSLKGGMGIGLRQLFASVAQSNGSITVDSQAGKTCFKIELLNLKDISFVQIEDDPMLQVFWKEQFQTEQLELQQFSSLEEFQNSKVRPKRQRFLFLDCYLNGKLVSLQKMKQLGTQFERLFLISGTEVTGYSNIGKLFTFN